MEPGEHKFIDHLPDWLKPLFLAADRSPVGAFFRRYWPTVLVVALVANLLGLTVSMLSARSGARDEAVLQLKDELGKAKAENRQSWQQWNESQSKLKEEANRANAAVAQLGQARQEFDQYRKNEPTAQQKVQELSKELATLNEKIQQQQSLIVNQAVAIHKDKEELAAALARSASQPGSSPVAPTPGASPLAIPIPRPAPAAETTPGPDIVELRRSLAESQTQAKQLAARLAAAGEELSRVRRLSDESARSLQQAQDELVSLRVHQAQYFAEVQAIYLATAAPAEEGLRARQTACRKAKMVQRIASLRKDAQRQSEIDALDRMEAVLTQLDIMDTASASAVQAFSRTLIHGEIVKKIDAWLGGGQVSPQMKIWLLEAKLILLGAEHVS